jgi:hypothetical protein
VVTLSDLFTKGGNDRFKKKEDPENRDNEEGSGLAWFLKSKPDCFSTFIITSGNRRDPSFFASI